MDPSYGPAPSLKRNNCSPRGGTDPGILSYLASALGLPELFFARLGCAGQAGGRTRSLLSLVSLSLLLSPEMTEEPGRKL